jgi:lysophospholipase L1-like esterase
MDCDEGVCLSMQAPPGISLSPSDCPEDGLRIMPLGDSLTDGLTVPGGYRVELWRQIAVAGLHDHFVGSLESGPGDLPERRHEGHSGLRIDQIQEHAAKWVSSAQPDVVLLMIGTNDVLQAHDLPGAKDRLGRLVDTILEAAPGVRLLLATLPPDDAAERQTREFNRAVPAIAHARAARVTLVDLHAALAGTPGLFPPGNCHPTVAGHRRIGDMWWSAIRALSPRRPCGSDTEVVR